MRIAFITTTFENTTNGPAKFARLLYDYSIANSKEVIFFTEDTKSSNKNVIKVHIPNWIDKPGIGFIYRSFKYFLAVRKMTSIEIVVSNNTMYNFLFNLLSNKKCVGFINDNEHFIRKKEITYASVRSTIFSFFEKFNLERNEITILNSKFLKEEIERISKKEYNLKILYKGIQTGEILDLTKHENDKILNILFVKTNYNAGGLNTLLRAVKDLENIHLNIVTSKNILNEPMMSLLNGVNYSYQLHHKLSQKEVFLLMKKSHLVCVPSFFEALGVVNMEAMLHSCAVISTNVGGIPEVLDEGRAGIMIEPNDFETLEKEIRNIHKNRDDRKVMIKYGHEFVQKFSINNTTANFFKIIND